MKNLIRSVLSRWFVVSLTVLIPLGLVIGQQSSAGTAANLVAPLASIIVPGVLFLMSITLDSQKLFNALARPWPVLWACGVNAIVLPLIAWPIAYGQLTEDFRIGLAISASVPSTMAAASVWTRRAAGNDAVSLLTTLLTNGLCFAYTPVLLVWLAGREVEMDVVAMAWRLFKTALIPAALGQVSRALLKPFFNVDRIKTLLGVIAQIGILVIVFGASASSGPRLAGVAASQSLAIVIMLFSCLILHLSAAVIAFVGAKRMRFSTGDARAALFAGSQKTLPIGLLIATDPTMLGNAGVPLAAFPILAYHMLQLFVDTVIADRLRRTHEMATGSETLTDTEVDASTITRPSGEQSNDRDTKD